jgi:YVTN family beta-propeller protein
MKLRISGLLAIAAFALAGVLGSAQSLAQNAYITNSGANTVSVIDTATNSVTTTIPVGDHPYGVAVTPDGSKVYVGNWFPGTVSVIETATNKVTATIPVGSIPWGMAVTLDGSKVYVANSGGQPFSVSVIDTATNTVIAIIPIPPSRGMAVAPRGVAVTPDGSKVYVSNTADLSNSAEPGSVSVIDTETNTVISTIHLVTVINDDSEGVAVSPDGSKVYVTNDALNNVVVINAATNTVTATISVGTGPLGVALTPDGSKVYIANIGDNNVSVIDTASKTVTATIPVGSNPIAFGIFVQPTKPAPRFAGTPGHSNCHGKSVSVLAQQFKGLNDAAAALGFSSVKALQNAILAFCGGKDRRSSVRPRRAINHPSRQRSALWEPAVPGSSQLDLGKRPFYPLPIALALLIGRCLWLGTGERVKDAQPR